MKASFDQRARVRKTKQTAGNRLSRALSFGFGGAALVVAMGLAGHYMGQNANARGLPEGKWADVVSPSTTIMRKQSLLGNVSLDDIDTLSAPKVQRVVASGKGGYLIDNSIITGRKERLARLQDLIVSPPTWKLEKSWKLGQSKKRKILAARRDRLAQRECLARAVYFEARGESELGQLAVAKVILNRVKAKTYPNTICGVVYQGAERPNSCQFSFACDGRKDLPRHSRSWRVAQTVAKRALAGGNQLTVISTATHYHADYVTPKWASAMNRLIKIGTHVFYRDNKS